MFHALKCTGEEVSLLSSIWTREELEQNRIKYKYFCPACNNEVILKLGYKQTWHFAHRKESNCEYATRGETEVHHRAKLEIYQWFKNHGYEPFIEHYLKELKQRPDIFIPIDEKGTVFEVQQGDIQDHVFNKRSESYAKYFFDQYWIGITSPNKQTSPYLYSAKRLHSLIIRIEPELQSIFLNIKERKWIIYKKFRYLSPQKLLAFPHIFPLTHSPQDFLHFVNFPSKIDTKSFDQFYLTKWKKEVMQKRQKIYFTLTPTERFMLRIFQQHFLNLNYFPALCALPLKTNIYFITSAIWWQSWLMLDYVNKTTVNGTISIGAAVNKIMQLVDQEIFHLRPLPKAKKDLVREAVVEYFQTLTRFSVLERKFVGVYVVRKQLTINKQLDILMKDDAYVQKIMASVWENNLKN